MNRLVMGIGALALLGGAYLYLNKPKETTECQATDSPWCDESGTPFQCSNGKWVPGGNPYICDTPTGLACNKVGDFILCEEAPSDYCAIEGSEACLGGTSLKCLNHAWTEGGAACADNRCSVKPCPQMCYGDDLLIAAPVRCVMDGAENVCQYVMGVQDYGYCKYPSPGTIEVYINGVLYDRTNPPIYQGIGEDECQVCSCELPGACNYNLFRGVDLDITFKVLDNMNRPLPGCDIYVKWECPGDIMGLKIHENPPRGPEWCGDYKVFNSQQDMILYTDANGFTTPGDLFLTQIKSGNAGGLYQLKLTCNFHDPSNIQAPLLMKYTFNIMGMGPFGGLGMETYNTCQYKEFEQES